MVAAPAEALHGCINNVVKAMQQAKLSGAAGSIPGELEQIIDKFLNYCDLSSSEADEKLGLKPGTVAKALSFQLHAEPKK